MIRTSGWSLLTLSLLAATVHAQEESGFAIRGRVVDVAGKPVAGVPVRLLAPSFGGLDVDEKATTDADGRFRFAAPKKWVRMDPTQRQELALLAVQGNRLAAMQFSRSSAPPTSEVELALSSAGETRITVLAPNMRPVVGAKVKIAGLRCDTIRVDLSEAELKAFAQKPRKTPVGYVIQTGTIGLPPEHQLEVGATDANGVATVGNMDAARIGAITVGTDEFGEQTVTYYSFVGANTPPGWPNRIVLKQVGRVAGQLVSPVAEAVAQREVTVSSFQQVNDGMFYTSNTKVVTDRDGKFDVPKMIAGTVRFMVKFDPSRPTRLGNATDMAQLKAGETLALKIDLKPAVRVVGRVLDAESKKPIPDLQVRVFTGMAFESTTSDAEGKFTFWMPPGETAFHPDIPDEYLSVLAPSDYLNPANHEKRVKIFKVPEGKTFDAPPILLHRAATLRGVVVDDQGRALAGSGISGISMSYDRRSGVPTPREVTAKTNERGEFTIAAVDPREPMRLRVSAKDASKVVTIGKPGTEAVRIVLAPNEGFHISGNVKDAEGKPVAHAVLEIWHRDWRPPPSQAEPKKLSLPEPIRADAQGRFKTPPLAGDGSYRFTIRAAGVKTVESAWLDATNPDTAKPQQLVVTRLGGVAGVVRTRDGKPLADVQVSLFAKDTRTETSTNKEGEFKLEMPAGTPFCVVVRHPDFRADGAYHDKNPPNLNQTMVRLTEPTEKLALRPLLPKEERDKIVKRLLEPIKQKLAKATDSQEKVGTLQSLTGVVPEFVTEFLEKNPLQPAMYNTMLLTQVAMKRVARDPEEAEELIGRLAQGAQKSMAYGMLIDALPEKARAKKLELLAEALVGARAEKSPEFRAVSLGQVAKRLYTLGEKDRATALLREGEKVAGGLSTSAFAGYARGCFATDLALIDLPAALALMKDVKDRNEFPRHHGNTAHRIAGTHPTEAVKVLDLIPPPRQNEFNQRDFYAIRVCYRMAQVDLKAALQLANSIADVPSRAYALGVMAEAVAKTDPKQALELMRRAFTLVEEDATRPDPPQLISALTAGSVAAALVLAAEQVDPTLVRECLWRAVALQRAHTADPQQVWRYSTTNSALAMAAARYDGKLAELLLPPPAQWASREAQLADFLTNPRRAVEAAEKASSAKDNRELVQLLAYLETTEERIPRLILNTLSMWRIDVEDIDFE